MGVVQGDRRAKRWFGAVMAVALAVPTLVWAAWPSAATANFAISRIGGPDRYDTSRQVAETAFPGGAAAVILANGLNYPDALAGSYLAGTQKLPIILSNPENLSAAAAQALKELKTKTVTVLGGKLAVSDNVVAQINALPSTNAAGGNVSASRLAGITRYETAASIATSGGAVGQISGQNAAIVASGENFPDALSAGPPAVANHLPILLTNKDHEAPQTEAALQQLNVKQVLLLGGPEAVQPAVATSLASGGGGRTVTRIGGVDRTDTAAQFYEYALKTLGFSNKTVFLANGTTYPAPDALAGSPLAGKPPTAILLASNADTLGQYTTSEISSHSATLTSGTILGQTLAISAAGQSAFASAAGGQGNVNGPITLNKTTVAPGGTIDGTVANPSTVDSLSVNGCGNPNTFLTIGTGGAFTVTVPTSQPGGQCALNFTVKYNNGQANDNPSFTISVSNPALMFQAPSLVSVTVTRGAPPVARDSAAFKFSEPLASALPNPAAFQLYREAGEYATGIGAPMLALDTWTVEFPAGSVVNATMGAVGPGVVTNLTGQPNFPGSQAVTAPSGSFVSPVPLTSLEPDLTAVGAPSQDSTGNSYFTSQFTFDKTFPTMPFPPQAAKVLTSTGTAPPAEGGITLNAFDTIIPGTSVPGTVSAPDKLSKLTVSGCGIPAATAQQLSFDTAGKFSVSIPAKTTPSADPANSTTKSGCSLIFTATDTATTLAIVPPSTVAVDVGYVYCTPYNGSGSPVDSDWALAGFAGAITGPATSTPQADAAVPPTGGFAAESVSVLASNGGTCPSSTTATVTFSGNGASKNLVAGYVLGNQATLTGAGATTYAAVYTATGGIDHLGNPLEIGFIPSAATSTWPALAEADEIP
ncbi:MAG: cell wall-binding repeat-containing protein, partial [Acidimicrobiales bacterium]